MGLLTNKLDGVFARRLGISTESLRGLDSNVYGVFVCLNLFSGNATLPYWIPVVLSIISRLEIIAILLVLKNWQHDVKRIAVAIRIRSNIYNSGPFEAAYV